MKTDNELIAEFMGGEITGHGVMFNGNAYSLIPNHLWPEVKYHTSWDWLMPVVEKINRTYSHCPSLEEYFERFQLVEDAVTNEWEILEAHAAVVEFIKWYNKQLSQPPL